MYSKPSGSRLPWLLKAVSWATRYGSVCAARFGKFGDTVLPFRPWQFEHTCCASVVAEMSGLPMSRERSTLTQPPAVSSPAAASPTRIACLIIEILLRRPECGCSVGQPRVDEDR